MGYDKLAEAIAGAGTVILDGYLGVFWDEIRTGLDTALTSLGVRTAWTDVSSSLLSPQAINQLIEPFLGGDDPIFGTRFTGARKTFDDAKLASLEPDSSADLNIVYGCGASLNWSGLLVYLDVQRTRFSSARVRAA
ncbi:MAG: hypothetical protein R3C44_18720 [Chloroflexota bacterium]